MVPLLSLVTFTKRAFPKSHKHTHLLSSSSLPAFSHYTLALCITPASLSITQTHSSSLYVLSLDPPLTILFLSVSLLLIYWYTAGAHTPVYEYRGKGRLIEGGTVVE